MWNDIRGKIKVKDENKERWSELGKGNVVNQFIIFFLNLSLDNECEKVVGIKIEEEKNNWYNV